MTDSIPRPPVKVLLFAEDREGYVPFELLIPRDEWEAMSPGVRKLCLDEAAAKHLGSIASSGWSIVDTDDYNQVAR